MIQRYSTVKDSFSYLRRAVQAAVRDQSIDVLVTSLFAASFAADLSRPSFRVMTEIPEAIVVVSGEPAKGHAVAAARKNSVAVKLEKLNLGQYETELVVEQGYDDLSMLEGLTTAELEQIADAVKMKPGHKKKFVSAFNDDDMKASNKSSPGTSTVDPSMIALQQQNDRMMEQLADLKKQQSAERLKKELEEKEKLMKEKLDAQREADRKEAEMRQKLNEVQLEQLKVQMQANMNLNLATANNQAQVAATPIVINNSVAAPMPVATPMPVSTPAANTETPAAMEAAGGETDDNTETPAAMEAAGGETDDKKDDKKDDEADTDPAVLKISLLFQKLDAQDWKLLSAAGLSEMLLPHKPKLVEARKK